LKQLAAAPMPAVEADDVSGRQPSHQNGDSPWSTAKQEMGVVVQKCPRIADRAGLRQQSGQPIQHVLMVVIVTKDLAALDAPNHHTARPPAYPVVRLVA
jgi:hypothetical protein